MPVGPILQLVTMLRCKVQQRAAQGRPAFRQLHLPEQRVTAFNEYKFLVYEYLSLNGEEEELFCAFEVFIIFITCKRICIIVIVTNVYMQL